MSPHLVVGNSLQDLHVHLHDGGETCDLGSYLRPVPEPGPVRLGAAARGKTLRLIIGFAPMLFDQGARVLLPSPTDLPPVLDPAGKDAKHSTSLSGPSPECAKRV